MEEKIHKLTVVPSKLSQQVIILRNKNKYRELLTRKNVPLSLNTSARKISFQKSLNSRLTNPNIYQGSHGRHMVFVVNSCLKQLVHCLFVYAQRAYYIIMHIQEHPMGTDYLKGLIFISTFRDHNTSQPTYNFQRQRWELAGCRRPEWSWFY